MLLQESKITQLKQYLILLFSIIVHLFLLYAVSDLYFTHHPDDNVEIIDSASSTPIAKRIVLFLTDGLNSESIFNSHLYKRLFITDFNEHPGTFGIAKAKFPTTERAGHLALLSGVFEDPAKAILNSIMDSEVALDNLINRTSNTWFWGHPNVMKIYNKGSKLKLLRADFNKSSSPSNLWIVSNIKEFLAKASKNYQFYNDQSLFIIHMPLSPLTKTISEKNTAIKILDTHIKKIVSSFNDAFLDRSTTFFVTSAYGLTDWGSHGGGSNSEVNTPILAWGAGIKMNTKPVNIQQIDFAALIPFLLSVSIPKNSLGILPVDYLDLPNRHLMSNKIFNAIQLSKIAESKRNLFDEMHYMKFHTKIPAFKGLDEEGLKDRLADIQFAMLHLNSEKQATAYQSFLSDIFEGIRYYETFYNLNLMYCIFLGFIFWIVYMFIGYSTCETTPTRFLWLRLPVGILFIALFISMIKAWSCPYYTLYLGFPFVMIWLAVPYVYIALTKLPLILKDQKVLSLLCIVHIQLLLWATLERQAVCLQILLIGLSAYIPKINKRPLSTKEEYMWPCFCVTLALSSLIKRLEILLSPLLIYGFCIWLYLLRKCQTQIWYDLAAMKVDPKIDWAVLSSQLLYFILIAIFKLYHSFFPVKYLLVPWFLVLVPLTLIMFSTRLPAVRMASVLFGMVPFYFLTAVSDEMISLLVFVATVYCWAIIEIDSDSHVGDVSIASFMTELDESNDEYVFIRRLYVTSVLVFAAFYSAGNVFNINSFNVWWFIGLVPSVNHTLSIFVVVLKLSTPIIVYFAILFASNRSSRVSSFNMICLLTVVFDVVILEMLLIFYFKDNIFLVQIDFTQIVAMTILNLLVIFSYILVDVLNTINCTLFGQKKIKEKLE